MQQRAEEHHEPEPTRPSSVEPVDQRSPSTADIAGSGNRPIVEPGRETPSNVTPIGSRGERSATAPAESRPATPPTDSGPRPMPERSDTATMRPDSASAPATAQSGTAAIAAGSGTASGTAAMANNAAGTSERTPLFANDEAERFRSDWHQVQAGFVDEPRHAVEQADEMVARTIKRLAEVFAQERSKLEEQWSRGDDVSTEDFRLALQRYRSFFDRLLSV